MTESGIIEHNTSLPSKESEKRIEDWLETGLTQNAVAAYGTSVENFLQLLENGEIPPILNSNEISYQKELQEHGGYLYYFHPLGENLSRANPSFYRKVIKNIQTRGSKFDLEDESAISNDRSVEMVRGYAKRNALIDKIDTLFGIRHPNVDVELIKLALDDQERSKAETVLEEDQSRESDAKTNEYATVKTADELADFIKQREIAPNTISKRRGVVLFFNEHIFDDSTLVPGVEVPDEFMVVRKTPLSLNSISGIEVYTLEEREELLKAA